LPLQVIAAKEVGSTAPVRSIEGSTFLYIRHKDMFFVAVTRQNANAGTYPPSSGGELRECSAQCSWHA
jgi:hypothetical protein